MLLLYDVSATALGEKKLLSQRATYILGPGEWQLNMQVVKSIWQMYDQAEVDLLAFQDMTHGALWFALTPPAPLGLGTMVQMRPRLHQL